MSGAAVIPLAIRVQRVQFDAPSCVRRHVGGVFCVWLLVVCSVACGSAEFVSRFAHAMCVLVYIREYNVCNLARFVFTA